MPKRRIRPYVGYCSVAGQTLMEVLVATVVLGVGLVSVLGAFSACVATVSLIRGETVAKAFCDSVMAQLRTNPSLLSTEEEGIVGQAYPGFTWRRRIRETPEHGVLAVQVTVRWTSQGVSREYVLESLVRTPRA